MQKVKLISWLDAAKQSLASLTFSLITPNRIGEYGAKALYYKKGERRNIVLLNFIGNFYQLFFTLFIGWIGLFYIKEELQGLVSKTIYYSSSVIFITFLCLFVALKMSARFKAWKQRFMARFKLISKISNGKVILLSFLRYIVFSHQFYFLLLIFEVDISYWNALACISSMYLIASIIPMLSLFDFVLKGSVAILIFSFFNISPLIIVSITSLMWIFNFAFPAFLGSYFVLTFKPKLT